MRSRAELLLEAQHLRQNPFNRLSFHYINDRACTVRRLPRGAPPAEDRSIGEAIGVENADALRECVREGFNVDLFAYTMFDLMTADLSKDWLRGWANGFGPALEVAIGPEYLRRERQARMARYAEIEHRNDELRDAA